MHFCNVEPALHLLPFVFSRVQSIPKVSQTRLPLASPVQVVNAQIEVGFMVVWVDNVRLIQ